MKILGTSKQNLIVEINQQELAILRSKTKTRMHDIEQKIYDSIKQNTRVTWGEIIRANRSRDPLYLNEVLDKLEHDNLIKMETTKRGRAYVLAGHVVTSDV